MTVPLKRWSVEVKYLMSRIYMTVCVKEVSILLCLVYLWINWLEETFKWDIICFENFLPWILNRLIGTMHNILHDMSEGKKYWFCWVIHISNQAHDNALNIIACLNSDVNDTTNPMAEWSPMRFFNLF